MLWACTLLPGSCGHKEPSPRPEAIPPPSIPMVELPWVGLTDEKVVLSNQNCSIPVRGNGQRGKAMGHRCDTRMGTQPGCEQLPHMNRGCTSTVRCDSEEK